MIGIYKIESKIKPDRCYIGSSVNIKYRCNKHLKLLKTGTHHSNKLQNHYNKYGEDDLIFSILIVCDKEDLLKHEQFFMDSNKIYFNILQNAGSCLGIKRTNEQRQQISERMIGKHPTEETREKLRKSHIGKHSHLGIPHSEETKDKISKNHANVSGKNSPCFGRKASKESRENMSRSHIGIQSGENHPMYNKHHSEKSKELMRKKKLGVPRTTQIWNKGISTKEYRENKLNPKLV